ncbi:Lrp/AsnC family transcriptional regulator [Natrarchaeobaculum sulfurireducens]|uniref:DNA-binding transcriptional regulator, Lrp family n=1 Tax=Natrarchaeobaculum sulfurireducens TaxID=2044521 RepID=A0A346PQY1_9EURY|nr:Lrp/AsnC family transcriptional regulator [Natrarchaeobaculum sulfurireducens]AXR78085.1 DNA-binding transcriptional regulator, Lrp family [Natrarchaeobaculum sulfurireducens]AXR81926.1 Transcriptional regulator, AsnC family [Natrarchaeobaculum sulfurireducens]
MDERDVRLLKAIAELGTGSPERLHDETDIPVSTIHYRLSNLREEGVITNDRYDIDLEKLGLGVTVIVEVHADYEGSYEEFADRMLTVEGVTNVFFTMGETDFIVIARLSDSDMVERLIAEFEELEGVDRTDSTFVIAVIEERDALQSYELETLLEELTDD